MRLGVYGGTFDPVHYGHLLTAEQCLEQCSLDEVWFVPASAPPHKPDSDITPGEQRAEMLELATAGHPGFRVSRVELERAGPSFTVDTLRQLRDAEPIRELFLIVGADSLADLPTWREPARILELAEVLVVNRGALDPDVQIVTETLGGNVAERFQMVSMPGIELSASDIRQRIRGGRSIRFMTPRSVEMYIRQAGLYRRTRDES